MTASYNAGASPNLTWNTLPWQKIQAQVYRLQMRIAKATREGRNGKARALQRLLTCSFYAKCLAVKRVVQNKGAHTPGIDKVLWRGNRQKMIAVESLKRKGYQPLPLRRIYIAKKNAGKRPLSIPCMKDRAMQALWLLALLPIAEEWADPNSYGFRPKRGVHDALEQCYRALFQRASAPWIFEGDIKSCFDKLSHAWLEENIPMDKTVLRKFLKAGFMEEGAFFPSLTGTPQGGILSPTLTLMALSGLEPLLKKIRPYHKINVVSYADDFIITSATRDVLESEIIPKVKDFLAERGLEISDTKSKITHIDEGFDFLGFHLRKYKGRFRIKPAKANIKRFLRDIRSLIKSKRAVTTEELIRQLNPKILGWSTFFKHVSSSKAFSTVDKEIYEALLGWMKRRHPSKSKTWRNKKYFRQAGLRAWQFTAQIKKAGELFPGYLDLVWAKHTPFQRFTKIQGRATPFDPEFKEYFEKRSKVYKASLSKRKLEEPWAEQRRWAAY